MKTAMQELMIHIGKKGIKNFPLDTLELIEELLEKEKKQIQNAVTYGNRQEYYDATEELGTHYYNETFKN